MHLSSAILWGGGDPGKIPLCMGTYRGGLNDHFTLQVGEMREVWFRKPCTPGKTGDFVKEIGQFQVVLHQDRCTEECGFTLSSWKMAECVSSGIVM